MAFTLATALSAIGAATGLASGIATMVQSGDDRPFETPGQAGVAEQLQGAFKQPITGSPTLGQGLGQPNVGNLSQRMARIGQRLGQGPNPMAGS